MARVITLDGLRVKSLKGRERQSCRKIGKSPMRSMNGEEMYRCVVEDGADLLGSEALTVGRLGEPSSPTSSSPSISPRPATRKRKLKRPVGRPPGSYGERRRGYVNTATGMRLNAVAQESKMAVTCRFHDPDGVYWDYNDNPESRWHGQYRCRCKTGNPRKGKWNTNYVLNKYCEQHNLPKDPRLSQQIKNDLAAQRKAAKARR